VDVIVLQQVAQRREQRRIVAGQRVLQSAAPVLYSTVMARTFFRPCVR
jgi:hypothetical protein